MRITTGAIAEVALTQGGNIAVVRTPADAATLALALAVEAVPSLIGRDGSNDLARAIGDTAPWLGVQAIGQVHNISQQADTAQNDSDKVITVPANELWHVLMLSVDLNTTATGGNRQVQVRIRDASDVVIMRFTARLVQAASNAFIYMYYPSAPAETATNFGIVSVPIPSDLWLPAGFDMRILDASAIAAAADDMTIRALVDIYEMA